MIELIQNFALVILTFMGIGIMLGIVRPRSVVVFLMLLLFLPFLISAVSTSFGSLVSSDLSWKGWLIAVVVGLVALRLFINLKVG